MTSLVAREQRAQTGVLQFAEEMQAIRDEKLYPNAGKKDAFQTYCKERWGMSESNVARVIMAAPVISRLAGDGKSVTVGAAEAVATLPEKVQDAILADKPKRDVARARAQEGRRLIKKAEKQGREPDLTDVVAKAMKARPKKKVKALVMPDELKDENLPPRLTPEDHGWWPRKLVGEALLSLWRAGEKMKDSSPPDDDARVETEAKLEKIITLAQGELAMLRSEGAVTDEDLQLLLEEAGS